MIKLNKFSLLAAGFYCFIFQLYSLPCLIDVNVADAYVCIFGLVNKKHVLAADLYFIMCPVIQTECIMSSDAPQEANI